MATSKRIRANRNRAASVSHGSSYRIFDDMLALAGTLAKGRKEIGAEKILAFADAAREFSLSVATIPQIKSYMTVAADSLEGLADYVVETEFEQMMDDAAVFAKRHPLAVMGAGIAGGLVATHLLRSNMGKTKPAKSTTSRAKTAKKTMPARRARPEGKTNGRAQLNA